jgi:hypothetical protein
MHIMCAAHASNLFVDLVIRTAQRFGKPLQVTMKTSQQTGQDTASSLLTHVLIDRRAGSGNGHLENILGRPAIIRFEQHCIVYLDLHVQSSTVVAQDAGSGDAHVLKCC